MENITEKNKNNNKKEYSVYIDYSIFNGKIRLIREGCPPVVMNRDEAIELAKAEGMNLVQVGYNKNDTVKPICKIINYGKFKYEQQKKEKEAKRKAKIANAEAKEVVFSIRIDTGDKNTKINHIKKFIVEDKMRVKISIKLSKREMNLLGMAKDLMHEILNNFDNIAELDINPSFNSGIMSCVIKPKK